jgi:hypothetical protein
MRRTGNTSVLPAIAMNVGVMLTTDFGVDCAAALVA